MRGYYEIAKTNDYTKGQKWLMKAKKWSERYENELELKWIRQNESVSF